LASSAPEGIRETSPMPGLLVMCLLSLSATSPSPTVGDLGTRFV
jgi:hypothetical protein